MRRPGYWVIPHAELRPLLLEWGKRNGYEQKSTWIHGSSGAPDSVTLQAAISFRSGVPQRRVAGILNDTLGTPYVRFDTADKLLCAIDMQAEWHGRLAEYYAEPIEVSLAESQRLLKVAA